MTVLQSPSWSALTDVTVMSRPAGPGPRHRNAVLRALSDAEFGLIASRLEEVPLRWGDILSEEGSEIQHFYFPLRGAVSLVMTTGGGDEAEVTAIGPEGFLGFPRLLGYRRAPVRSIVQISGAAVRIECDELIGRFEPDSRPHRLLKRYLGAQMTQALRVSACNALHSVEQRCACWLLMAHDRAGENRFDLTQSFLSELLGVRRATVSVVCASFQRAGLITWRRGAIEIVGRRLLERAACECYAVTRRQLDSSLDVSA